MAEVKSGKGVWLPEELLLSEAAVDLSCAERMLVAMVHALDNEDGCWASNAWLAARIGCTEKNMSRVIAGLAEKGWLAVDGEAYLKVKGKYVRRRVLKSLMLARLSPPQNEGANSESPPQNADANSNSPPQNADQKNSKRYQSKKTEKKEPSEADLFENPPVEPTNPKAEKTPYSRFVDLHFELHPCKPIFGKTEGAIVKQILKDQDLEVALAKLRRYYKGDLWFTQDKQFSLKGFRAHYNEIPVNGNGAYRPSGVGAGRFSEASWERIKNLMPSGGARGSV